MSAASGGDLVAHDLAVAFGSQVILDRIDTRFRLGTVTAIVGPNGAGKSTLLACLAGLRRPDTGRVTLGQAPVLALPHRERARRIGFLPQTPEIAWAVDVETLVGLGRTPHSGARGLSEADHSAVRAALVRTRMTSFARRDVTTLSGGERARALLARVLASEPAWLLADEPLAGLDPGHQLDTVDLLRAFAAEDGHGVVMTLHDLGVALRLADRVIVLRGGKLIADAAPLQALTPAVLAQAYGVEAAIVTGTAGPLIEMIGRRDG